MPKELFSERFNHLPGFQSRPLDMGPAVSPSRFFQGGFTMVRKSISHRLDQLCNIQVIIRLAPIGRQHGPFIIGQRPPGCSLYLLAQSCLVLILVEV
jgi:hypothetical protein